MTFKKLIGMAALALCANTSAMAGGFEGVPTDWKLESYGTNGVVVWFAGTPCSNGQLNLPPTATVTDHNRFYATVMAAKLASAKMFVYYDDAKNCAIISYGMR